MSGNADSPGSPPSHSAAEYIRMGLVGRTIVSAEIVQGSIPAWAKIINLVLDDGAVVKFSAPIPGVAVTLERP